MDQQILQKFSQLPAEIKNALSGSEFLGVIEGLEEKYQTKLVVAFISLVTGDSLLPDLETKIQGAVAPEAAKEIINQFSKLFGLFKNRFQTSPRTSPNLSLERRGIMRGGKGEEQHEKAEGEVRRGNANFSFSMEDEAEVDKFKSMFAGGSLSGDYALLADKVIVEFGFSDPKEVIGRRFQGIIVARLRGVRDDLETLDALKKGRKIGGMEFTSDVADKILKLIKSKLTGAVKSDSAEAKSDLIFPQSKTIKASAPALPISLKTKIQASQNDYRQLFNDATPVVPAPISPPFQGGAGGGLPKDSGAIPLLSKERLGEVMKDGVESKPVSVSGSFPTIKQEGGLPVINLPDDDLMVMPKVMGFKAGPGNVTPKTIPQSRSVGSVPQPRPVPHPTSNAVSPNTLSHQQSSKPRLDDIRFTKKLVGPIEELEYMTLIDFRRLAGSVTTATKKIQEKVDLLEKDSYGKRIEGVEAWHKNEVNKFYRLLGHKSIEEGVGIDRIISERLGAGKPTLSLEEFNAVMELNKQLRY